MSSLLTEQVIERKGVCYGAAYAQDFRSVRHVRIDSMTDYYHLIARSKYNISSLKGVFSKVKADLDKGILVMFTGTPCQIFSLKKYLNRDYTNLLTVDLLCHGVSKQDVLKNYIDKIETDYKSKVISLNMRDHHTTTTTAIMEDGQIFKDKGIIHEVFINEKYLHNMCKKCNRHYGNNVSDITLGDFWEIEKNVPNDSLFTNENVTKLGINKIKINTAKGEKFFSAISGNIVFKKV